MPHPLPAPPAVGNPWEAEPQPQPEPQPKHLDIGGLGAAKVASEGGRIQRRAHHHQAKVVGAGGAHALRRQRGRAGRRAGQRGGGLEHRIMGGACEGRRARAAGQGASPYGGGTSSGSPSCPPCACASALCPTLSRPNRTSVATVRSCASSRTTTCGWWRGMSQESWTIEKSRMVAEVGKESPAEGVVNTYHRPSLVAQPTMHTCTSVLQPAGQPASLLLPTLPSPARPLPTLYRRRAGSTSASRSSMPSAGRARREAVPLCGLCRRPSPGCLAPCRSSSRWDGMPCSQSSRPRLERRAARQALARYNPGSEAGPHL